MAAEASKFPPPGVRFSFIEPQHKALRIIRSPIKGYFGHYDGGECDLIEAVISPIITESRWVYSLACFQEAMAFSVLGAPLPRALRRSYVGSLFLRDNFRAFVFWSRAGKETLHTYGGVSDERIISKSHVIYPAIRRIENIREPLDGDDVTLLFSGSFFQKGGANVIDAFERVQRLHPMVRLKLCCDEQIDFPTLDQDLKNTYLRKINSNKGIEWCGRVPRDEFLGSILPNADVYLLPTYGEAFGFAVLEAMACGIPVIATNVFAIPEMIEDGVSGYLIDTLEFDHKRLFRGGLVHNIPADFREYVTDKLFELICRLIESVELRREFGKAGQQTARNKFSIESRNEKMLQLYREAVG